VLTALTVLTVLTQKRGVWSACGLPSTKIPAGLPHALQETVTRVRPNRPRPVTVLMETVLMEQWLNPANHSTEKTEGLWSAA